MPTFLVSSKMDPGLRGRIERSVLAGHRKARTARLPPRTVALVRFLCAALAVTLVASVVLGRRAQKLSLEAGRASLLAAVRSESASLSPYSRGVLARVHQRLAKASVAYEGDLLPTSVRGPGALAQLFTRASIYLRAPIGAVSNVEAIARAAASSQRDGFSLCLLNPPAGRDEKALLARVQHSDAGSLSLAPKVHRLLEAEVGQPFFLPSWEQRVASAETPEEVKTLRGMFEKAPLDAAKAALSAELLLFVLDEPGDTEGPTEIDGERPHWARVEIFDISGENTLLRLRKRVDPNGLSPAGRAAHAALLDSCALAFDVTADVEGRTAGLNR